MAERDSLKTILARIETSHQTASEILSELTRERLVELSRETDGKTLSKNQLDNRFEELKNSMVNTNEKIQLALEAQLERVGGQLKSAVLFKRTTADYISKLAQLHGQPKRDP